MAGAPPPSHRKGVRGGKKRKKEAILFHFLLITPVEIVPRAACLAAQLLQLPAVAARGAARLCCWNLCEIPPCGQSLESPQQRRMCWPSPFCSLSLSLLPSHTHSLFLLSPISTALLPHSNKDAYRKTICFCCTMRHFATTENPLFFRSLLKIEIFPALFVSCNYAPRHEGIWILCK